MASDNENPTISFLKFSQEQMMCNLGEEISSPLEAIIKKFCSIYLWAWYPAESFINYRSSSLSCRNVNKKDLSLHFCRLSLVIHGTVDTASPRKPHRC